MRVQTARTLVRILAVGSLALALSLVFPAQPAADSTSPAAYRQAVEDTLLLVRGALPNDTTTANRALAVLQGGTGSTQGEIIADLEATPPDFADAIDRLQALLDALDHPADTADPAQAQRRLNNVLAMHRYLRADRSTRKEK